jgi:serine/threonine protein kinase
LDIQLNNNLLSRICKNIVTAIQDVNAYCDQPNDNWLNEGSVFIDSASGQVRVVYFGIFNCFKRMLKGKFYRPIKKNNIVLYMLLTKLMSQVNCASDMKELIKKYKTDENFEVEKLLEQLDPNGHQPTTSGGYHESRLITDYENFQRLGEGSFGTVFRATSVLDKVNFAIKIIKYEDEDDDDRGSLKKYAEEAATLAKLDHANIVRYFSSWQDRNTIAAIEELRIREQPSLIEELTMSDSSNSDGHVAESYHGNGDLDDPPTQEIDWEPMPAIVNIKYLCIHMEYCGDSTLRKAIDRGLISDRFRYSYAIQLAAGLKYIHSKNINIIHRDLKPENIFLCNNRKQLKIGDFGLATNQLMRNHCGQDFETNANACLTNGVGTSDYMAPELLQYCQTQRIKYTSQVDLYSLGIIIFELFSPKFSDRFDRKKSIREIREIPARFGDRCTLSEPMKTLIKNLLAFDPDSIQQYRPTADKVIEELRILKKLFKEDNNRKRELSDMTNTMTSLQGFSRPKKSKLSHLPN